MLSSHQCCTARKDSSYAPVFQCERIGSITAKSPLVLLNDAMMLETKGQSDQQAIIIVSYAMLRVPQQHTMGGILLYNVFVPLSRVTHPNVKQIDYIVS